MSWFKKYLPSLLAVGSTALVVYTPALQAAVASHPALSFTLTMVSVIVAHLLPSPVAP